MMNRNEGGMFFLLKQDLKDWLKKKKAMGQLYNTMRKTEGANQAFLFWGTRGPFMKIQCSKPKVECTWSKLLRFLKGSSIKRTAFAVAIPEMAITVIIHLNNLENKISAMIQSFNLVTMIYYKLLWVVLQNKALELPLELTVDWANTLLRMGRAVPCFALQFLSLSCHPKRRNAQ